MSSIHNIIGFDVTYTLIYIALGELFLHGVNNTQLQWLVLFRAKKQIAIKLQTFHCTTLGEDGSHGLLLPTVLHSQLQWLTITYTII